MKRYYVLSIVGALVVSTMVGTSWVAAETDVISKPATATAQSSSLERLVAQSEHANTTWRRPL
jgi:hypothetical protein